MDAGGNIRMEEDTDGGDKLGLALFGVEKGE
jgi:hypothetical protein